MGEGRIASSRYEYVHEKGNWPSGVIDIHHVRVRRSRRLVRVLLLFVPCVSVLFWLKGDLDVFMLCYLLIGVLFVRLVIRKQVEKDFKENLKERNELKEMLGGREYLESTESVLIFPAFGVQLETHYKSGRVNRRFVPVNKILKPMLNECLTPVTCYWSLALLLREENELMLVFKELHPTLEMLTPMWKALCAGVDPPK